MPVPSFVSIIYFESTAHAATHKRTHIPWDITWESPQTTAFRQKEFIVQMIDEFHFLNAMIYRDKEMKPLADTLAGGSLSYDPYYSAWSTGLAAARTTDISTPGKATREPESLQKVSHLVFTRGLLRIQEQPGLMVMTVGAIAVAKLKLRGQYSALDCLQLIGIQVRNSLFV